ncbi:hypothetical protein [Bradyrhizobium sp.]|uniref:hypothetical protein n=1 Tax=Bradyrhizobium sp. TaxID=376 RepID=UPI003D0F1043
MWALAAGLWSSLFFTDEVWPHDALPTAAQPEGWSYPFSCCSGYDCRSLGDGRSEAGERVIEAADGYRFTTSTEVVPYSDRRVKDSPDGEFHWCTVHGKPDGKTICLFVPPRGM